MDHRSDSEKLGQRYTTQRDDTNVGSTRSVERRHLRRKASREQRRNKTGQAPLPRVILAPTSALGPTGDRQAVVAFAEGAPGDLPEECRFFLSTQMMFMKKEKEPTTKIFDDDEWIRSLTEADTPEEQVTYAA